MNVSLTRALSERTEARRVTALAALDPVQQVRHGQFFTPRLAAELIASMPRLPKNGTLRVLDPGAGVGSLAAAVVERAHEHSPRLKVHVVCVELDEAVLPWLRETAQDMEAAGALVDVVQGDFIADGSGVFRSAVFDEPFDLVVQNPPYGKLPARSLYRASLQAEGVDCPNVYAAFMALGHRMLRKGGQIVAIVPRSFANGAYFDDFRADLLRSVALDRLHEFGSRSMVFADTGVLQENVVVSATKGSPPDVVTLSLSVGHTDAVEVRQAPHAAVVRPDDPRRFIRFPGQNAQDSAGDVPRMTLASLGLKVSTGKVVDFRARDYLAAAHVDGSVPLVYPGNLRGGRVEWPREMHKAQGFVVSDAFSRKRLFPEGLYVLIKRFTAKEERRRVVAAVWDRPGEVAVENHLNVIHRKGSGLDPDLAAGLCLWLNSTRLDVLFREFSGHTQVNATDLRALPFPDEETLRAWGAGYSGALPTQADIDALVETAA